MASVVFKGLSIIAYIAQYFFYVLAGIVAFGGMCFLVFKPMVTDVLIEFKLPYWLLIWLTVMAILILILYGLIARYCQPIFKNLSQETYFAKTNIVSSLRLVWIFALILTIQFISNVTLYYFAIRNASDLFSQSSFGDYRLNLVFLLIAFTGHLILKNGRAAQEDSESII
ncbi:hypothetical protein [Streptococcus sp. S784/96/1]|uniref:hypothetical protein n=1 Tax=Streptococcus sp. S784/96/1 TaxID=2653499 RepID=UPI0013873844|nr:hypothetical protein [Streptococcus sp. S784/96/1]